MHQSRRPAFQDAHPPHRFEPRTHSTQQPLTSRTQVLFKLKPGVSQNQIAEMRAAGDAMVGAVPGLRSFDLGPPLASTAHRARGFDMALVAVLDTEEQVLGYAGHPAHQKCVLQAFSGLCMCECREADVPGGFRLHRLREAVCTETLAYDLVVS